MSQQTFTGRKRIRKTFGKIPEVTTMPNLIETQKQSYDQLLQKDMEHEERREVGRSCSTSATSSRSRSTTSRSASSAA
jgi:DNA-directed RNA polymerase beta subunit